ncbi:MULTISPECIES: glucosylglycerol biosynthesis transcriptional repressor GgpR [unclassified Synechocystis]|uniref:glucosylglycerol biosynthesis transcriptional repressor GgpR n=1 Tax=unclassified Synechocystis TaxID=2640012 RepID=UPI0003F97E22|nr:MULTISPECIES: glucosylglycerol biosynthesis transcriptional repressor GgpR [unclassified Synechocystis]
MRSSNRKKLIHPAHTNSFKVNKKNRIYRNQWRISQVMLPASEVEILPEKLFLLLYLTSNYFFSGLVTAHQKPKIGRLPLLFPTGPGEKGD